MDDHKQRENGAEVHPASEKVSVLNCIDLSGSDIHQSVSLLKQVVFLRIRYKETNDTIALLSYFLLDSSKLML